MIRARLELEVVDLFGVLTRSRESHHTIYNEDRETHCARLRGHTVILNATVLRPEKRMCDARQVMYGGKVEKKTAISPRRGHVFHNRTISGLLLRLTSSFFQQHYFRYSGALLLPSAIAYSGIRVKFEPSYELLCYNPGESPVLHYGGLNTMDHVKDLAFLFGALYGHIHTEITNRPNANASLVLRNLIF